MLGGVAAHAQHSHECLDHAVFVERPTVTVLEPAESADVLECLAELLDFALGVDERLKPGKLQILAVEALVLIENALEGAHERGLGTLAFLPLATLGVHVEENRLGGHRGYAPHTCVDHLVVDLAVEVVDRTLALHFRVREKIAQHLQEVGFARAEEAADPYTRLARRLVERVFVVSEERGEVSLQFLGHDVFLELLLHEVLVDVADLDHAVDVPVDIMLEHVLDMHVCCLS